MATRLLIICAATAAAADHVHVNLDPNQPATSAFTNDYVIFSMQRSGTTSLCTHINQQPNVHCKFELLNFGPNQDGFKLAEAMDMQMPRMAPPPKKLAFLERAREHVCGGERCSFGYKVFPEHVRKMNPKSLLRGGKTCVIYRRQNVTAQYLSWKRGTVTGCWGTTPDKQKVKCEPWVPVVDPAEFEGFRAKTDRWYERAEAACEGVETVHFTMEQFTGKA